MSHIEKFFRFNHRLCEMVERHLPSAFTRHLHTVYKYEVARLINERHGQTVADVGGGKECPFLRFIQQHAAPRIVSVDIADDELRQNSEIKWRVVADAANKLPFSDESIDLIVSRSVVEHLANVEKFFKECERLLRPGGYTVHTFPSKFSPFSIINQILPNYIAKKLLYFFYPNWSHVCGFPAYYDGCYYSSIIKMLKSSGFDVIKVDIRYYQSIYYTFLFPMYVIMVLYDLVLFKMGAKNLACQLLVVAKKRT